MATARILTHSIDVRTQIFSVSTSIEEIDMEALPGIAAAPVISGDLTVDSELSVSGTWPSYQWYANGIAIPGATSATYTIQDADEGKLITVGVGIPGGTVYAAPVGPIWIVDNLYTFPALIRMIPNYDGDLFTIRRWSDDEEETFGADEETGLPDRAAILAWLDNSMGFIVTAFDQTGHGRDFTQADPDLQPELEWHGLIPAAQGSLKELRSAGSVDVARNVTELGLIMFRANGDPRRGNAQQPLIVSVPGGGGTNPRASFRGVAVSGTDGASRIAGRREDADATVQSPGLVSTASWRLEVGAFDYGNARADHWLTDEFFDTDEHEELDPFHDPGSTDNTASLAVTIGSAFEGSWLFAGLTTDLPDAGDKNRLRERLPDMYAYDADAPMIPTASWAWSSNHLAQWRSSVLYFGAVADRLGNQAVTTVPGTRHHFADYYGEDDHQGVSQEWHADGWSVGAYTGHNNNSNFYFRISPTGDPEDYGAEQNIPQVGTATYAVTFIYGDTLIIFTRAGGSATWSVNVCENADANTVAADFAAPQQVYTHTAFGSGNTYMNFTDRDNDPVEYAFCYDNPEFESNSVHLLEFNKVTGSFSADGVALGNWDGSSEGGNTLPVDISDLPVIYEVPVGKSIRMMAVKPDGTAFLYVEFDAGPDPTTGVYRWGRFTGSDMYDPADWNHADIISAGESLDPLLWRWGGGDFANEAHTGERLYIAREANGIHIVNRLDSLAGDGSDMTIAELRRSPHPLMVPLSPKGADNDAPLLVREIWDRTEGQSSIVNSGNRALLIWNPWQPVGVPLELATFDSTTTTFDSTSMTWDRTE